MASTCCFFKVSVAGTVTQKHLFSRLPLCLVSLERCKTQQMCHQMFLSVYQFVVNQHFTGFKHKNKRETRVPGVLLHKYTYYQRCGALRKKKTVSQDFQMCRICPSLWCSMLFCYLLEVSNAKKDLRNESARVF